MRANILRWGLVLGLLTVSFYFLHGDTSLPEYVVDSLSLLKKPVEDLLPDLDQTPEETVSETSLDLDAYQDLHFSRERWNEMRRLIEAGKPIYEPLPSEVIISTSPVGRLAPEVPPPPGFTVNLPYASRLTVSGRKTIGVDYKSTTFTNPTFAVEQGIPVSQNSFTLTQQLQVRINGQVGRKVTVNVDFDDTKPDKKDISIVYKGDPDEVVQRAAFGDITLSLPQTEFAGYNKQIFGATVELKYKALHAYLIGSRTKGQSETKSFTGNVILQRLNIPDIAYVRHQYYNLAKLNLPSALYPLNTSTLQVILDNRDITRPPQLFTTAQGQNFANYPLDFSILTAAQPGLNLTTQQATGNFVQLSAGIDYTYDPVANIITFKNPIVLNALVGIDFVGANGARLSTTQGTSQALKMLKFDESQTPAIPITEDLTHYNTGVTQIVRDNGQGNFTLQLRDLNNNPLGQSLNPQIIYLPNNAGTINMNFQTGIFYLTTPLPFSSVYLQSPTSQSSFFVEIQARVKTYTLRPNIVLNSERITLNGRVLTRDVDYFIDYQSGFVTFFNPDLIDQNTQIVATYDFSPFGIAGAQQDTLVGARTELSMYPLSSTLSQSLIGTTVLYDFAPKSVTAPDIRQTAGSFLVTESDIHFNNLTLPFLKSTFAAEGARSASNPNTFGQALIDSMQGIAAENDANLSLLNWQISATPSQSAGTVTCSPTIPCGANYLAMAGTLGNELLPTLTVNPNASALPSDQTQVLDVPYNLALSSEASIVTVLSTTGLDFSKKLYVQMYVQGDGTNNTPVGPSRTQMDVTLGQITEDADGTGGGGYFDAQGVCHPFTDTRGGVSVTHTCGDRTPRTEDVNYNNTLDVGEDTGWSYVNPDHSVVQVGANNLHLDSEDLNRNGVLDSGDTTIGGDMGYAASMTSTSHFTNPGASGQDTVDFSGWQIVQIPIEISSATAAQWTAIQDVRISLRPSPGFAGTSGLIKIGKIGIVGITYQAQPPIVNGSTITARSIDNNTDPNFNAPTQFADFNNLNQINTTLSGPTPSKQKFTALAMDYAFASGLPYGTQGASVTVQNVTSSPMDFTPYGQIKFFLYSDGQGETFIFRVGTNTDYLEYDVPVTWTAGTWNEITINQLLDSSQRAYTWSSGPGGTAVQVGNPSLSSVSQITLGVINNNPAATSGELWMIDIFAADAQTRIGYAGRMQSDFEVPGWTKFGASVRSIDRNFQTVNTAVGNQDVHEDKAYLNFIRFAYFPLNLEGHKNWTETPNVQQITNTSLVSIQQQGLVDDEFYSANGTLQIPKWPKFGLLYDHDRLDTHDLFRTDKTDHYGGTFDYAIPFQRAYLPKTVSFGYKRTELDSDFGSEAVEEAFLNGTDPFQVSPTKDVTNDISAKMAFQPHPGFTFNPNYAYSSTHESKDEIIASSDPVTGAVTQTGVTPADYDTLRSQTMGFDGVLGIKRWFSPRLRYTVTNRETFGIPLSAEPTAYFQKSVDRSDTGEMGWDFAWRDFSKRFRPLQSLNVSSSFLMEDGDSWSNVPAGYNTLNFLSVRQSLSPGGGDPNNPANSPQRTQLTLRNTLRSTQRWSPFDWATQWSGAALPLRTLSMTSTVTDTKQHTEVTGTPSDIVTRIVPDLVLSMTQTEYFLHAQRFMSNSQMNIKTQYKTVDTAGTSHETTFTNGGDWRFTVWKKVDAFFSYTRTTDTTFDEVNNVVSNDAYNDTLSAQLGFNVGKWRITPKYDQSIQTAYNAGGVATTDLTTRTPAVQAYADLFLPAGLKLPFSDLIVFSNRVRTTSTLSLTQKRSSLNELQNNSDTYALTSSEDYELTSNMRLTVGFGYSYQVNKISSEANFYSYDFNSLLTIQF